LARIVLNTFGSLGDLHPYLALAIELRRRGHDAVIATSEVYRQKIVAEGVAFTPVRPDVGLLANNPGLVRRLWDPLRGSEALFRDYLIPQIEDSYEDLFSACRGADLLLTHIAGLAGPIVAEQLELRWLSIALQPIVFFSSYDPPVLSGFEWARRFYPFGPGVFQALMAAARLRFKRWAHPIQRLRRRLGLSTWKTDLLVNTFSPRGTLALFSKWFAAPQPDWPPRTHITGFIYYDRLGAISDAQEDDPAELDDFLRSGPPPLLFTLGSSVVMDAGDFFQESIVAAHALGLRAVLVAGGRRNEIHNPLPDSILVAGYVPFSRIMPHALAIVHQGGIGTTAQALRAGRPMLVAPWGHDQPDNAERLRRLGAARTIPRTRYYAPRVTNELRALLADPSYEECARALAGGIAHEDGLASACDAIEAALRNAG